MQVGTRLHPVTLEQLTRGQAVTTETAAAIRSPGPRALGPRQDAPTNRPTCVGGEKYALLDDIGTNFGSCLFTYLAKMLQHLPRVRRRNSTFSVDGAPEEKPDDLFSFHRSMWSLTTLIYREFFSLARETAMGVVITQRRARAISVFLEYLVLAY